MTRIAAVVGSTGLQGGGVVRALLKDGWTVRGLTRDSNSARSKAIKDLGAEIVVADITKAEDLKRAFSGADAVFAVTDFWTLGEENEVKAGKLMADIAKQEKVSHFVFSSADNSDKISGGKNKVPHFTSKAHVDDYIASIGLPATYVQIACYYENWQGGMTPRPNKEGIYEFTVSVPADSKIALGSASDLGHVVAKVLGNKEQYLGKTIAVAGDYLTPDEIAATLSKVWGKQVRANIVPHEVFAKFPFPAAAELADMFSWFDHFGYFGEKVNGRDIWEGKKIYPGLRTWEQFLKEELPKPLN